MNKLIKLMIVIALSINVSCKRAIIDIKDLNLNQHCDKIIAQIHEGSLIKVLANNHWGYNITIDSSGNITFFVLNEDPPLVSYRAHMVISSEKIVFEKLQEAGIEQLPQVSTKIQCESYNHTRYTQVYLLFLTPEREVILSLSTDFKENNNFDKSRCLEYDMSSKKIMECKI